MRHRRHTHSRPTAEEAELPRRRTKRGWEVAERVAKCAGKKVKGSMPLPQHELRHGYLVGGVNGGTLGLAHIGFVFVFVCQRRISRTGLGWVRSEPNCRIDI